MKLMIVTPTLAIAAIMAVSAPGAANDSTQREIDKKAFLRAQKAAAAETWTASLAVLKSIDVDKIEDVDVITYVDFSTRCAALAEELGVDRQSDPSDTKKTFAEMDFAKFFASMWDIVKKRGITEAARVVVEARRIQKQVPMYLKLDQKLSKRFR